MRGIFKLALLTSSGLAGGIAVPVWAQATTPSSQVSSTVAQASELSDIVVTATKTGEQSLQKTPLAISVVDQKLLEGQGLSAIKDFAKYVPNLVFAQNAGQAIVYIRGIGSNNASAGSDPSVTEQVDGVYIARPTAQFGDFLDIERVEVLRGPQGTLYGRNAVGGTLNIISRQPSAVLGGEVRLGYGNYNTRSAEAYLTGPLVGDTLTASVSGTYRYHDEFFRNVVSGVPGTGKVDRAGARAQLRWQATPALDMTLRADFSQARDTIEVYDHLLIPPAYSPRAAALVGQYGSVALDGAQPLRLNTQGTSFDINYNLGGGFRLKSITSYRHMDTNYAGDADGTDVNLLYTTVQERQNQATQEFNLSYVSSDLHAVAGAYFFGDRDFQDSNSNQPASFATPVARSNIANAATTIKTRSYAVFGQADYNITSKLSVIVGGRYTTETKTIDQNFTRTLLNPATLGASVPGFPVIFTDKRHDKAFTPKFGINYQLTSDVLLYASATRGFKAGGYNNAALSKATAGFNPEHVWAYEAGAKTQFFNDKLRLNIAGFDYDYSDLQVRQRLDAATIVISNAANARIKGVELEGALKVLRNLQISGNVSYLHAAYGSFPSDPVGAGFAALVPSLTPCPNGGLCYNASGHRIEGSPDWSGLVAIDYSPSLGNSGYHLDLHVDTYQRSLVYYDASNIPISAQGAYGLLNANVSLRAPAGWRIEAYVNNATGTNFYQNIGNAATVPAGVVGDPRTFGMRIGYKF